MDEHKLAVRLLVSGHVPATLIAQQAIVQGFDEVHHVNMPLLNLWPEITEARTPARFIATLGAVEVMGKQGELGSLAPGKLADLAVVPGDPTQDIGGLRPIETVLEGGTVYDSAALYAASGVAPAAGE